MPEHPGTPPAPISVSGTAGPATCTALVRRATAPGEAGTVEAGAALLSAGEPAYPM